MTVRSWPEVRIRFVGRLNPSKSEVSSLPRDTEVTFLPMDAIGDDGSIRLDAARRLEAVDQGYTYFRDGDVAIAKITPCFENGKGALMSGLLGGVGFGTTELIIVRPDHCRITGPFLQWLFTSPHFRNAAEAAMYGAGGQKRVPDNFVRDFGLLLPTLPEQSAIAAFLDRGTGKIDALVAEQERLIALLKEKRQAVISHAVTKGLNPNAPMKDSGVLWLGEVPAHWEVRSISSLTTKITNGYVGPTRDILMVDGIRYLQSLHIKQNQISFHTPYYVSPEWSAQHSKSVLLAGDVLVVQTGDVGQTAVVNDEFAGCNCHALIILAPKSILLTGHWLSWVLNSSLGQQTLASIQTGALHPHLNCGDVKDIRIPLPPVSEQKKLTDKIERDSEGLMQLETEATRAITLLRERRAALISAAVTGKIDVRDTVAQTSSQAA